MKNAILALLLILITTAAAYYYLNNHSELISDTDSEPGLGEEIPISKENPLSIEALKNGSYPGSDPVIEQTLTPGSNYKGYVVSYLSEGNKIYALLTIPNGTKPETGWPIIIFNHGYIPPEQYRTTEKYIAYTDAFSKNGYIVLKSDYRGHGSSEGQATGGYGSNAYTIDVLNGLASVRKLPEADPNRVGMWGHSMGGSITLKSMVINQNIKAAVIWAGVVASYPDLINNWRRRVTPSPSPLPSNNPSRSWRKTLVEQFGEPTMSSEFWRSISANAYLDNLSGPVQLHHGTADDSVPVEFSINLEKEIKAAGKEAELYTYPGNDHNISKSFGTAIKRSVDFFDKHVKGV